MKRLKVKRDKRPVKILNFKPWVWASVILILASTAAKADLEWITGGVPKNPTGNMPAVKDAPTGLSTSSAPNQDVIVSHMITTTRILNEYPVDSVNYFYLDKNNQVSYFAYFLIKPSSRIHTATVECFSPSNLRIAKFDQEFQVGFTDRLLTIQNETYQWFLVTTTFGMDHLHSEYGQTGLPRDVGLYTIHLTVDGQLVGITFFYVKSQEPKTPTAIATIPPAEKPNPFPMATPFSNIPIPKGIQ